MSGGISKLDPWLTPPPLGRRLAEWAIRSTEEGRPAGAPLLRWLEPSAGRGALAELLVSYHEALGEQAVLEAQEGRRPLVTLVELHAGRARALAERFGGPPWLRIWRREFCGWAEEIADEEGPDAYDVALMNPPSDGGEDVEHVLAALTISKRVIALLRSTAIHTKAWGEVLARARLTRRITFLGRPGFQSDEPRATSGDSPRHDFLVADLVRAPERRTGRLVDTVVEEAIRP